MVGAIAHDKADALRAVLSGPLQAPDGDAVDLPEATRDALIYLVDILESSPDAVVFPVDAFLSTQQVADLLGVSRMTVTRLVDKGELPAASGGGAHRRVAATELARYRSQSKRRRSNVLRELAQEISDDTPPDRVVRTR